MVPVRPAAVTRCRTFAFEVCTAGASPKITVVDRQVTITNASTRPFRSRPALFCSTSLIRREPTLRERVAAVREFRQRSKSAPTRALADTPTLYHVNVVPGGPFLVVPKVSSERRAYVPIGWLEPPTIPSDLVFVLQSATKPIFALLTSAMHMAWLRHIGGRLKSDYRYSIGLVYNTFPLPPGFADADTSALDPLAHAVLDARAAHADATLADMYDPDLMPPDLRKAHQTLDRAVDRLYRRKRFTSERERVEYLFELYDRLQAPLAVQTAV